MIRLEDASEGLLDFHNHSTYSDGSDIPYKLVERAKNHGVTAMALTDHHGIGGLPEFRDACERLGMFAIPFGMEISAELPKKVLTPRDMSSPDLVILGRNPNTAPIKEYQKIYFHDLETRHLPTVLDGLESVGFEIPPVNIKEQVASFHVPPDILHDFIQYKNNIQVLIGYVQGIEPNIKEEEIREKPIRFVNRYLYAVGMPAYTSRFEGFTFGEAVGLAEEMNCRLFIAHPGGEYGYLTDAMLNYMIENRVHGIEIRNYFNSQEQNQKFDELVRTHNLIRSGGSDYHGDKGSFKIGIYDKLHNQLPKDILEELWENLPN